MVKVIYLSADGRRAEIDAAEGETVMRAAVLNSVDGIVGECGGAMMCATCHCYVDPDWADRTGGFAQGEEEMLEAASSEITRHSRLSCQIRLTTALDGLVVRLPKDQL